MKVRTQGGWCLLNYNRHLKIFLDTSDNRREIQFFVHELAFKLAKREPFSGLENATLQDLNEPTRSVVLTFNKNGKLVLETIAKDGETLRKTEKREVVEELLLSLCGGEGNFKESLFKVMEHFDNLKSNKKTRKN